LGFGFYEVKGAIILAVSLISNICLQEYAPQNEDFYSLL
jgi:hypothetical protein